MKGYFSLSLSASAKVFQGTHDPDVSGAKLRETGRAQSVSVRLELGKTARRTC